MNNFYFIFYRCNTIILASQFIIKLSSGHRTGKGQFSFQSQRRAMPKNVQTTAQLHSFHMLMLKILQARLKQYVNWELPDVQAGFRKGRGTRNQRVNIFWRISRISSLRYHKHCLRNAPIIVYRGLRSLKLLFS